MVREISGDELEVINRYHGWHDNDSGYAALCEMPSQMLKLWTEAKEQAGGTFTVCSHHHKSALVSAVLLQKTNGKTFLVGAWGPEDTCYTKTVATPMVRGWAASEQIRIASKLRHWWSALDVPIVLLSGAFAVGPVVGIYLLPLTSSFVTSSWPIKILVGCTWLLMLVSALASILVPRQLLRQRREELLRDLTEQLSIIRSCGIST